MWPCVAVDATVRGTRTFGASQAPGDAENMGSARRRAGCAGDWTVEGRSAQALYGDVLFSRYRHAYGEGMRTPNHWRIYFTDASHERDITIHDALARSTSMASGGRVKMLGALKQSKTGLSGAHIRHNRERPPTVTMVGSP